MNEHEHDRDPELISLEMTLNRLAEAERCAPDADFEQRLHRAVHEQVLTPAPISLESARHAVWWKDPINLAAAASVVLVGAVAVLFWRAGSPMGPTTLHSPGSVVLDVTPAQEVEQFIETVAWLQEAVPDLDALVEQAESIGSSDEALWDELEQTFSVTEESI
ncbi:MAG: hypothetical protein Kow0022_04030 [Phycisphaerales bacterium]